MRFLTKRTKNNENIAPSNKTTPKNTHIKNKIKYISHAYTIQKYVEKKTPLRASVCVLSAHFPKFPVVLHIFSVHLQKENLQYTSFGPHRGSSIRRREIATQITSIPTATTITVAIIGTIKFKSNHSGIQWAK